MMKKHILILFTLFASLQFLLADGIEVGQPVPQVSGIDQNEKPVDLGKACSEGITFIFFYPKADTPGCTAQACSMRDSYEMLVHKGVKVFGISYDTPADQRAFKEKYQLPYELISDEDKTVSEAFGRGSWAREAYLIKDGTVIWRDLHAATRTQAEDVIKALKANGLLDVDS